MTHLKRPWCWERLKAGGEGDDRGWDGWMASPAQWTWVWVNSRSWRWTGRPGMLQSMGLHSDTAEQLNWTELIMQNSSNYGKYYSSYVIITLNISDMKSWLIGKDPDGRKDWGQEEEGTTEDEMVGWPHRLNGHVFERTQSWWWKRRPGVLQFMGLQRIGHDWATELTWTGGESKVQCCKEQYCIGTWNLMPTNQGKLEEIKQEMTSWTLRF